MSVILPVRNGARHIEATLSALLNGEWPSDRLQILVADGRSLDDTRAIVQRVAEQEPPGRVRLLDNPARITPAGLNVAIAAADGDIILRMDAHALPTSDYIPRCVDALRDSGAWAVGGPMVGRGETRFGEAVAHATALLLGTGGAGYRDAARAGPVDTVYLGAWPRAVLEHLGGFDEGLPTNQDYELNLRIRAAGGTVWLDPSIRSTTITRGSPAALARQYHGYGRGRAATWRRHPRSLRARQVAPAVLVATLAGLGILSPFHPSSRRALALLLTLYTGALAVFARRGSSSAHGSGPGVSQAHVAAAWATMHLAWGGGFWRGLILDGRSAQRSLEMVAEPDSDPDPDPAPVPPRVGPAPSDQRTP